MKTIIWLTFMIALGYALGYIFLRQHAVGAASLGFLIGLIIRYIKNAASEVTEAALDTFD